MLQHPPRPDRLRWLGACHASKTARPLSMADGRTDSTTLNSFNFTVSHKFRVSRCFFCFVWARWTQPCFVSRASQVDIKNALHTDLQRINHVYKVARQISASENIAYFERRRRRPAKAVVVSPHINCDIFNRPRRNMPKRERSAPHVCVCVTVVYEIHYLCPARWPSVERIVRIVSHRRNIVIPHAHTAQE